MNIKKSTLFTLFAGTLLGTSISAQHNNELFNDGAVIHIQAGAEVHVLGDVHMTKSTGELNNNGLMKVQGNLYSDGLFEQRGTGTTRIENSSVNVGERQFISGSYAVRGGTAATGVNDGSFYNLELANDQGIVYLVNTGAGMNPEYVADVRNSVNFQAGGVLNRIVTADIGMTGAITYPANGSNYNAEFGIMNPTAGLGSMTNNTATTNGNSSSVDAGYIQGKQRRAITAAGGVYGFLVGLEPASIIGQRGFQYIHLTMQPNTYDVIRCYFESGSSNAATPDIECSGYQMDNFWGDRHGEWIFDDMNGVNGGDYEVAVWPQDPSTAFSGTTWTISKDDVFLYPRTNPLHNVCGTSSTGLTRGPFNGFSQFGLVSATILLESKITTIDATPIQNKFIKVDWATSQEKNLDYFEIERSTDDMNFQTIASINAVGNSSQLQNYNINDNAVLPNVYYYYRIKSIDDAGTFEYTNSVVASLTRTGAVDNVNLFPNPITDGTVTLEVTATTEKTLNIGIYDAIGQLVVSKTTTVQKGFNQVSLDASQWPAGVYFVHINSDTFSTIKELIKSE